MPFGKRPFQKAAHSPSRTAIATLPEITEAPGADRHAAFQVLFEQLFAMTTVIADAVRGESTFFVRLMGEEPDPLGGPIEIRDLAEHFVLEQQGETLHPFFVYVSPTRLDHLDPSAQFQLEGLIRRIREINVYCQQAAADNAINVALQAPGFPEKVDRLLAGLAFFIGFFENLQATQPFISSGGGGRERPDFARLQAKIERRQLMAVDRMSYPERIAEFLPTHPWPHLGVEVLRRTEAGGRLINGVYFPADYARQLIERQAREHDNLGLINA